MDFDAMVADGALEAGGGPWWRVLDMDRLPQHAKGRIVAMTQTDDGVLLKFSNRRA